MKTIAFIYDYDIHNFEEIRKLEKEQLTNEQRCYLKNGLRVVFFSLPKTELNEFIFMGFIGFNGLTGDDDLYELGRFDFSSEKELEEKYKNKQDFIFENLSCNKEQYGKFLAEEIRKVSIKII